MDFQDGHTIFLGVFLESIVVFIFQKKKVKTFKKKKMIRYFDLNSNALDKVQRDVATKILSISKGCMYHH